MFRTLSPLIKNHGVRLDAATWLLVVGRDDPPGAILLLLCLLIVEALSRVSIHISSLEAMTRKLTLHWSSLTSALGV